MQSRLRAGRGRRPLIFAIVAGVGALLATGAFVLRHGAAAKQDARPGGAADVLLITIDTLRADAVGAYGHPANPTPWTDRLAAAGTRFESARAQAPLTLPSHATILSGRYPFAHQVRDNSGFRLPETIGTLPVWLHDRGYRTGAFVSAFPLDQRFGLARGFDVYDDRLSSSPPHPFLEQERSAVETVARARAWLAASDGRPSFCWVHVYEPHYPYKPPPPYASRFADDLYEGEVAAADAALAPLLQPVLERDGRRTIVVLTADHGESLGEHGEATHGIFAYDATLRVPLIVLAPGLMPAGVRSDPVRLVDIAPTVMDLLSIPAPSDLDGRSLRQPSGREASIAYFEALSGAFNRGWAPIRGVVRGGLKFVDLPIPELYDLSADPGERHNVAPVRSGDVQALRTLLGRFPIAVAQPHAETAAARERLAALGYVAGGAGLRNRYTEADDPKRLIGIDKDLQAIVGDEVTGNLEGALATARRVAEQYPQMPLAALHLAQLQRETGDMRSAVETLARASERDPSNVQIATLLGASLTQQGRAADAVRKLEPLASAPDADVEVLRTLAIARARTGAQDDALRLLQRARSVDHDNAQLFVDEATIQLIAGRRVEAAAALEEALHRDPDMALAHSTFAALLSDEGRAEEAAVHWRAAAARDPAEFSRIFALGVAEARAGHAAQARIALDFFVTSAPPAQYAPQISQARAWLASKR